MQEWLTATPLLLVVPRGHRGSEAVSLAYESASRTSSMEVVRMSDENSGRAKEALRCLEEALVLYDTQYVRCAKFRGAHPVARFSGFEKARWVMGIKAECYLAANHNHRQRAQHLIGALFCASNFKLRLSMAKEKGKPFLPWGEMDQSRAKALGLDQWENLRDVNRWFRSSL